MIKIWAERKKGNNDATVLEAEAIRTSLIVAYLTRWNKVDIKSSNRELLRKLKNRAVDDVKLETLLEDVLHLSSLFPLCLFSWNCSNSMSKANMLASFAVKLTSMISWKNHFPSWLTMPD
ncbi:hypothetical protein ACH5RR_013665 [Cinchona calisaya]|uniref:RNase H type-1 domain-containing protein n=1 Tax=Cinchona calisaya TaxID=153742 RepID=A0ABD3A238_9GENT